MTWLFEDPLPLLVIGLLLAAILMAGFFQTGKKPLFLASLACGCLTLAVFLVSRWVVTDREAVEATLHQIARDVERNDVEAAVGHIHPEARQAYEMAQSELPKYRFEDVDIKSNLQITVDTQQQPVEAIAEFNASVTVSEKSGLFSGQRIPRYVVVTFWKEEDGWKVVHYEHREPQAGFLERSPQ